MKEQKLFRMQSSLSEILDFNLVNSQLVNNVDLELIKDNSRNEIDSREKMISISDDVLKTLINLSTDIITVLNPDGTILFESDSIEVILGYTKDELVGLNAFSFIHKDDVFKVLAEFERGFKNPGTSIISLFRYRKADGSYTYLESTGTNFNIPGNSNIVVISRDVSSRIKSEKRLNRLTAAVEQSSNTVVITDINGNIEYVNKKFIDLTGYCKEEVIGQNPSVLHSGETPGEVYKDMWTTILTGRVWEGELRNRKKTGELYWERIKITPIIDKNDFITNFIAIKDDISKEKQINEKLEQNLIEKEIMLKEIHHRVKNNLQIVISLLNLQSASLDDLKLKNQLTVSQNRVRSMALIHQLLYRSNDLSNIDMEEYLFSLSGQLLSTYSEIKDRIKVNVNVKDIWFSIETAVPFGLLINEMISNSLKHGFPDGRKGNIEITLIRKEAGYFELNYYDDGIGIPLNVINGHAAGFGMQLIDMLVKQIEGEIKLLPSGGTNYKIYFSGSNSQSRLHNT